jgi:general secretion pathway protein D
MNLVFMYQQSSMKSLRIWLVLLVTGLVSGLGGCASQPTNHDLAYYQRMVEEYPQNQIFKLELQRAEFLKEQEINRKAQEMINLVRYDAAALIVAEGLAELPESLILKELKEKLVDLSDSIAAYDNAIKLIEQGEVVAAIDALEQSVRLDPGNDEAMTLLKRIKKRQIPSRRVDTIDLNFNKLELRSAIEFIARSYGINVIFDESVKDVPVTLDIDSLDFYQALDLMLQMSRHYFKVVDSKTIVVYPDSKDKRAQYEELMLRAVQLEFINVKDMAAILKAVLNIGNITLNESSNLLMIRESPQVMGLVDQLITINDVPQPQVLLDVEILEINKSNSRQAGVDFGSYQIGLSTDSIPISESILGSINENSEMTIPSVSLKALKQDVDAKILANPKVRVVNQKQAKIHIGDRVPLRSSSILDATGQTRTTFEYQEIGIRLAVKPQIHPNNDTTLEVSLEVSALGENLGTTEEPAFRIGSRNAETMMVLKDGESVLLGGLIREEERRSFSTFPGIERDSFLAKLFSFSDTSEGRTDVLLTITPRVIRKNRLNEVLHDLEMETGTLERTYAPTNDAIYRLRVGAPKFTSIDQMEADQRLNLSIDSGLTAESSAKVVGDQVRRSEHTHNAPPAPELTPSQNDVGQAPRPVNDSSPVLSVTPDKQEVASGAEVTLRLQVTSPEDLRQIASGILFNPNILEFVGAEVIQPYTTDVAVNLDSTGGSASIEVDVNPDLQGELDAVGVIELTFKALRNGTSFIVLKTPVLTSEGGGKQGGIARNGRVTIN